jgi:predicted esterase
VGCSDPPVEPDRFVGLAGPYDVVRARAVATDLFGPDSPDPAEWSAGNPLVHAANRPQVDVLLVHGRSDQTVPTQFTESFADALEKGGHAVTVSYPQSVDHHTIYSTDVVAPIIAEWLDL